MPWQGAASVAVVGKNCLRQAVSDEVQVSVCDDEEIGISAFYQTASMLRIAGKKVVHLMTEFGAGVSGLCCPGGLCDTWEDDKLGTVRTTYGG